MLLKAGATTPVHLGSGNGISVSPDSRWALGLPVTGYPSWSIRLDLANRRTLPNPENIVYNLVAWQDATHVIGFGQKSGELSRGCCRTSTGVRRDHLRQQAPAW